MSHGLVIEGGWREGYRKLEGGEKRRVQEGRHWQSQVFFAQTQNTGTLRYRDDKRVRKGKQGPQTYSHR